MRNYFIRTPDWATLLYPKAIWSSMSGSIEWTIDDGPDPLSTPLWLELLDELNIRATFFVTGKKVEQYPDLLTDIISSGHKVGSHGYDHLDGWRTSSDVYLNDFRKSMSLIDTHLFRPPYGRMKQNQYKKIAGQCEIMMWNMMPGDFDQNVSSKELVNRLSKVRKGDIIVLHDQSPCIQKVTIALKSMMENQLVHLIN